VQSAVATLKDGKSNTLKGDIDGITLVAFVILKEEGAPGASLLPVKGSKSKFRGPTAPSDFPSTGPGLRAFLGSKVPAYMVPRNVVFVHSIPLTASGKVDRKALVHNLLNATPPKQESLDEQHKVMQPIEDNAIQVHVDRLRGLTKFGYGQHELDLALIDSMCSLIASRTGVTLPDKKDPEIPLSLLGIDSANAVTVAASLSNMLLRGNEFPHDFLLTDRSLSSLCEFVRDQVVLELAEKDSVDSP